MPKQEHSAFAADYRKRSGRVTSFKQFTTMQDLRFAFRQLLKNPGFTSVAVLTLALGISANSTIFGIISTFYFQPLPVKDPDQLVLVLQKSDAWKMPHGHSWPDYLDYRERVTAFTDAIAIMLSPAHLSFAGRQPERTWIEAVSGNYFSMLGIGPQLGRLFRPGEGERVGSDPVIVLSHQYWQTTLGGDQGVVGKILNVNGNPFTIVGVAPESFLSAQWSMAPSAFVPASMAGHLREGGEEMLKNRGAPAFKVMARLKPGATFADAKAELEVVSRQIINEYPDEHRGSRVFVAPERHCRPEPTFAEIMPLAASIFMAMVLLVLFIACANVANLMFSRALVRQKEMGIRTAIGATRWRLMRQLLIESVLLGLVAGVAGYFLSFWSEVLLAGFSPAGDIPVRTETAWDWRVLVFTFGVSVLAGVVTGIFPSLQATRVDIQTTLKEGGGSLLASGRHVFRSVLVVSQVAICVVVLVAAGLFVRSLQQVAALDLGFRTDQLVMASLDLSLQGYDDERGKEFCRQLTGQIKTLPGVRSAALARSVPFDYGFEISFVASEKMASDKDSFTVVHNNRVDPEYFTTMGTTLLRGRAFTDQDKGNAPKVAIINALMAERFWPQEEALGKRFRWGEKGDFLEVVGVVRNGRYVMLGEEPRPYFYVPLAQSYTSPVTLHVWTIGDPAAFVPSLRKVLGELDPHLPVYSVRTMPEHLRSSAFATMPLRMGATLAGVQGLLALALAVMGIYGVVAYVVSQRTREVGIRMALGAQKLDILRLVVRDGLRLTLIGVALGLVGALGVAMVIGKVLYGLSPASLPVIIGVVLLLGSVTFVACYLPARRAMKVDPMVALRYE
jgi:predicted permease